MVRALLAGRKTQTRRLATSPLARCAVGDRLYVREHWKTSLGFDEFSPKDLPTNASILCLADHTVPTQAFASAWGKHRQGMHMPRWASRLTLLVEGVRTEPLQSISEADAIAEGLSWRPVLEAWVAIPDGCWPAFTDPRRSYAGLWQSLHDKASQRWEDNPEVLVLTFSVRHGNIDRISA